MPILPTNFSKSFSSQLFPEESVKAEEWDLSLSELNKCIAAVPEEAVKEELLGGLNNVVSKLSSDPLRPIKNQKYFSGYGT